MITIILIALASLILGMGLPVTAAYIVLATLSAPALYNLMAESRLIDLLVSGQLPEAAHMIFMLAAPEKLSLLSAPMSEADAINLLALVPTDFMGQLMDQAMPAETLTMLLLSAHMIIFWLSQDSNVTPPVCLTAFAAAAIAKTPPMATGFTAWKIAKGLYIVPLLFAYTNFIGGTTAEVLSIFIFAVFGLYAFVGVMEGYLEGPLNIVLRLLAAVATIGLLWPHGNLLISLAALAIFIGVFMASQKAGDKAEAATN